MSCRRVPVPWARVAAQLVRPASQVGRRKREPGASPGLPRSGEWEREPSPQHWVRPGKRRPVGGTDRCRARESEDLPAVPCAPRTARSRPRGRVRTALPACRGRPGSAREERAVIETRATVLGYPRMGPDRELKRVTEGFWAGQVCRRRPARRRRRAAARHLAAAVGRRPGRAARQRLLPVRPGARHRGRCSARSRPGTRPRCRRTRPTGTWPSTSRWPAAPTGWRRWR